MASFLDHRDIAQPSEAKVHLRWLDGKSGQPNNCRKLLASIPDTKKCSFAPMATLSALLQSQCHLRWPVLELQRTYIRLWKILPEHAKAGHTSFVQQQLLHEVTKRCKESYSSLITLFHPARTEQAIIDAGNGTSASHLQIFRAIREFRLPTKATTEAFKPTVAISLPNGPLLAITMLATATYYRAAPIAHGSGVGKEQFRRDILRSKSDIILASIADVERLGLNDRWLVEAGITVLLIELTEDMGVILTDLKGRKIDFSTLQEPSPNRADDICIILSTSGTSGAKKLVPISTHSLVCGVAMVEESWGLSPSMRCLNQMPLYHIGGLVRNLFAPMFSGGSVVCCSTFDANLFWDCVEDYAPTWYYASPSMHQAILDAGADRPQSRAKSRIRLVCNAAGGLLPSLAAKLRDTFSSQSNECVVLPSYGMTECMPVSTPPLNYRLERPGTSGESVGPEIAILDDEDQPRPFPGELGRIAVRGAPVFDGYLDENNVIDKSCFTADGWFDTGDMGHLDEQGFLYITGRTKEVINRGGELISPFEVEEAIINAARQRESQIYGRVSEALAFSVPHSTLQEAVGIVITTPEGKRRPCLRSIAKSTESLLSHVKRPTLIVYMEGGLPTNNNKLLRIKLSERLDLPEISNHTSAAEKYFEAKCPAPNTPISTPIKCERLEMCQVDLETTCAAVIPYHYDFHIRRGDLYPEVLLAPKDDDSSSVSTPAEIDTDGLLDRLRPELHGYDMPSKIMCMIQPFSRNSLDEIDACILEKSMHHGFSSFGHSNNAALETSVAGLFSQILALPPSYVTSDSNFFDLGGDSMGAGRLLTVLRKEYDVRIPIDTLFTNPTVQQLVSFIAKRISADQMEPTMKTAQTNVRDSDFMPTCERTCNSTSLVLMLIQLLPIALFYPMKRAVTWTAFMHALAETQHWPTNNSIPGRLFNLVVSITIGGTLTQMIAPLAAIAFKWLVVGRYREGIYPMWGSYHTRWWLVEKAVATSGMGLFNTCNFSRIWYLRLLGAQVGKNVTIQKGASLGEWDLITLEDGAVLDRCVVRPFAAERNTLMYLGRIRIGSNASIGLSSIVAAGHTVPAETCIGPNSSSWEMMEAADEANRGLSSSRIPNAHWALLTMVGLPLQALVKFIGAIPWLASLVALVRYQPDQGEKDLLKVVIQWFASSDRVGYHYLALVANVAVGPFMLLVAVVVVKEMFEACFGKIEPGAADQRSQMDRFRMRWLRTVMPVPQFHKLTELFGTHYEMTSSFARLLGAKVGKRVYWPGTGPSIQDFDLLDIGDDVVFGSRSHLVTSDGTGSDFVTIRSSAMVADRVTLLPGVELGEKTVMGSGALTKRNRRYQANSTWVGSKAGEAVRLSVDTPKYTVSAGKHATAGSKQRIFGSRRDRMQLDAIPAINSTSTTLASEKQHLDSETSSLSKEERGKRVRKLESTEATAKTPPSNTIYPHNNMPDFQKSTKSGESTTPFGRGFYEGKATYRVWSQLEVFLYSTLISVAVRVYWNVASISSVQVVSRLYSSDSIIVPIFLAERPWRPLPMYVLMVVLIAAIMALQTIVVLVGLIAAKWILMGRRKQGNYDWDKSPYCQRWQLFLKLESFRRHCYGGNGILGMLTGTHWLVLYFRALGARIGHNCSLFSSGAPSLMFTEPDLLTLGDRVCVDDASLVGHINTRGKFDLNPLSVGARSVLRTGSRLLSGATMEEDTCLLEHTLVMGGDVVTSGSTMQGWPAEEFAGGHEGRMPTLEVGHVWRVKVLGEEEEEKVNSDRASAVV